MEENNINITRNLSYPDRINCIWKVLAIQVDPADPFREILSDPHDLTDQQIVYHKSIKRKAF